MSAVTPEIVKELLNTPAGRRALSKASPEFFDTYYCGMRAARHRTTWLDAFDDLVTSTKDTSRKGRLLVMAPRGHGKTEMCISAALRQICLDREVKILWIAEASTSAIKRVARVRALLKSPRIVEDWCSAPEEGYGPFFEGPQVKDTDTLVIVNRKKSPVDGTLEAVGSGGGVTGGHPDIIVCHEAGTPMLHEGEWVPVEDHPSFRGLRRCDGVEVSTWALPFPEVVTPEHRYWARARNHQKGDKTKRGHHDTPAGWVEARNLTEFHMLGTPIDYTVSDVFPPLRRYRPSGRCGVWEDVEAEEFTDPEWWWALGLWWGDGHLQGRDRQLVWSCPHNRPENVERLQALAARYGRRLTKSIPGAVPRPAMDTYLLSNAPLGRWLRTWYGDGGKLPPAWVERLPHGAQIAFLRGYLDADGYVTERDVRLTSVNLDGLLMVRRMLGRHGIAATLRLGPPAGDGEINGRSHRSKQRYDLRFNVGREVLGYAPALPQRSRRDFIEDGFIWSKIRTTRKVGPRDFAPIKTKGSVYVTHFGLSHNCDDLEDDRTTNTLQLRQATRTWWNGTIEPMLGPGGVVFMVGTRKHNDDLYGHIKRNAAWKVLEDPAIKRWPSEWEYQIEADEFGRKTLAGVTYSDDYEVLWPEERGLEFLLLECRYGKELEFAREYQHQVQDDSRAVFRMDWLNAAKQRGAGMVLYGERPAGLGKLRIVQAWDLALVTDRKMAEQLDRDYTVGVTWASDGQGNRYLLGMFRERGLTPLELRNAVISEYRRFGGEVAEIVVERNSFGNLHYMGLVQSTDLPVRAHDTTGTKKTDPFKGVPAMGHLFEADKVWLPTGDEFSRRMVDVLCTELWGLGKERHDDAVMALWIAEFRLREHGFGHQIIINGRDLTGAGGGDEGSSRVSRYGPSPEDHGEGRDTSEVLESWPLYGW